MEIPLSKRLKRASHVEIAMLQDEIVSVAYSLLDDAVLHGGTAVWRCYKGNRFSEDLDFYAPSIRSNFQGEISSELDKRGLQLLKFKKSQNTVFAKISSGRVEVSLELALRKAGKAIAMPYENADGSFIDVFTLPLHELIKEKMLAYLNRKFVRDLYDVYYLSGLAQGFSSIAHECSRFIKEAKPPVDEKNLKALVYSGIAPSAEHMLQMLSRRLRQ